MLRHVIERKHPAVGILAIREAMRSNQRIQELELLAAELLRTGQWMPYEQGQRPHFPDDPHLALPMVASPRGDEDLPAAVERQSVTVG